MANGTTNISIVSWPKEPATITRRRPDRHPGPGAALHPDLRADLRQERVHHRHHDLRPTRGADDDPRGDQALRLRRQVRSPRRSQQGRARPASKPTRAPSSTDAREPSRAADPATTAQAHAGDADRPAAAPTPRPAAPVPLGASRPGFAETTARIVRQRRHPSSRRKSRWGSARPSESSSGLSTSSALRAQPRTPSSSASAVTPTRPWTSSSISSPPRPPPSATGRALRQHHGRWQPLDVGVRVRARDRGPGSAGWRRSVSSAR